MKGLSLVGLIVLAAGCVSVSPMTPKGATNAWSEFVSEEGRFSVMLPTSPSVDQRTLDTGSAPSVLNVFVSEGHNSAYVVVYRDLDSEITSQMTTEEILETTDDSAQSNPNQEVLSFDPIQVDGHSGRSLTIRDSKSGAVTQTRAFVVGSRLYSVGVTTLPSDVSSDDSQRFFESFKIRS